MRKTFLLLMALITAAAPTGAVDLDSLLVQSVGGPEAMKTLTAMTSYRTVGKANLNGLIGDYTQVYVAPDKFYMEIRLGGMNLIQAYDGATAWKQDHNGRISEVEGMEKRQLLKQLYLASYSFVVPNRVPGETALLSDTVFDGSSYYRVALFPLRQDTVTLLLEKPTALPRYIFEKMDNLSAVTHLTHYRTVRDVAMAFFARTDFREVTLFTEMTMDTAEFNTPVDPGLFHMPGTEQSDFRFEDGADSVVIPFLYHRGHIWLPATINGIVSSWFILDSGASANLFNASATDRLNLTRTGSMPAMGIGGFDEIPLVRTDSVAIGSLTLLNQIAGVIELAALGIHPPQGKSSGGILGHDFLSRFPVLIDYQDSTITVYNPATFTPPTGGTVIDFHLTLLVPTISASISGISGDFIVDLGNAVGLVIHDNFFETKNLDTLLTDIKELGGALTGLGGEARTLSAVIPEFQLGDIQLTRVPVIIPESTRGLAGSEALAGNIGNLVLEQFRILLDYNESRLYLYPGQDSR